jgi:hypothetical protein
VVLEELLVGDAMIFTVALTWCGRPSGCRSRTSVCRCTVDHDGTSSMSARASRIASGEASNTISRVARTAMSKSY